MNSTKTNQLTIRTPEGIVFSLKLACPVTRFLALTIDLACISLLTTLVNVVVFFLALLSTDLAWAFMALSYFLISIGYGIVMEWFWQGRTIGKRVLHLRVMDVHGLRLQFSQVVVRNLFRFVDYLPGLYLVGGFACLVSARSQRLGDVAANTIVVWSPAIRQPALDTIASDKYNSLRDYPHLAARLRQRTTPAETDIALRALFRKNILEPVARVELFGKIAAHFRSIVQFPQEATDGLSDERYVHNVVDLLMQQSQARSGKTQAG